MQPRVLSSFARPCRFIAHRRYPVSSCYHFHQSTSFRSSTPQSPHPGADPSPNDVTVQDHAAARETTISPPRRHFKRGEAPYGSGVRRAMRNKKHSREDVPLVATVPGWFQEQNIVLHSNVESPETLSATKVGIQNTRRGTDESSKHNLTEGGEGGNDDGSLPPPEGTRYLLSHTVWEELYSSARVGLRLPAAEFANEPAAMRSHLVLQYPGNDGILFLDAVVHKLAHILGANLITLNAQDIAELCSEQDRAENGITSSIRLLGYDVYRPSSGLTWQEFEDNADSDGEGEDAETDIASPPRARLDLGSPKFITIESPRDLTAFTLPNLFNSKSLVSSLNLSASEAAPSSNLSQNIVERLDQRWLRLVNELIPTTVERLPSSPSTSTMRANTNGDLLAERSRQGMATIIQVQDYKDIQASRDGLKFISFLQQVIQARRREGLPVLLVGTVTRDVPPPIDQENPRFIQNTFDDQFTKTLIVTPAMDVMTAEKVFSEDRMRRIMEINIRHLQSMLRTRLNEDPKSTDQSIIRDRLWALDPAVVKESGLDERFWTYNHVHRVATLALGCTGPGEQLTFQHIQHGMQLLEQADHVRNEWLQNRQQASIPPKPVNNRQQSLKELRKTCNSHEKKLLNGVVDAECIRTTFADVHVPPETIEALKTLTTLSLIRPEAFAYGVLATDRIPGLLLYGPPGTGKTLLAKAVARESGATVLEVSGSEVYDMYVGEGEKNVKAIFTLAKKLSPCVVFIDEADAILCSRTGASNRNSHRELINQFLREWDGMDYVSALIMVATNRPFDLDDAVLRRLPRRLLVDLPTEQDRLSILKIHLKDELLDPSVDLAQLARHTPLYSGSDLKNLCVAAALACVREENDFAAKHNGQEEPYQYPERRILTMAHFERGMEEISASISEDMSSLTAIRRFDERYGDRKGRRKKDSGWGFTPPSEAGKIADTARVRT